MIENDSIQVVHQLLCLKMELGLVSETLPFFKNYRMDTVPKKNVSVNFTHAVFRLFDFLTLVLKHK
jgi:hypothetical protein